MVSSVLEGAKWLADFLVPLLSYRNHDTQAPVICVGTHTYTHLGIHEIKIRIGSGIIVSGERIDIFIIKVLEYFILIQTFAF